MFLVNSISIEGITPCLSLASTKETYPYGPITSLTFKPKISTSLKLFLLTNRQFGDVDIISI